MKVPPTKCSTVGCSQKATWVDEGHPRCGSEKDGPACFRSPDAVLCCVCRSPATHRAVMRVRLDENTSNEQAAMDRLIAPYCDSHGAPDKASRLPLIDPAHPPRINRHKLHLITAFMWSTRSLCKRLPVGCVITSQDLKRVLAIGYNGPARGLPDDRCRGTPGTCGCLHAEDNAVAAVDSTILNKVAFVTHQPCEQCAQRLIQANVTQVYYGKEYRDSAGADVLKLAGIPAELLLLTSSDLSWAKVLTSLTQSAT